MTTPRQITFITNLLAEREVPDALRGQATALLERNVGRPSPLIDALCALPRLPRAAVAAGEDRFAHLRALPSSNYALEWEQLHAAGVTELARGNQVTFFRVKEWRDRVFLDQLHGAPGAFNRTRLTAAQERAVAGAIRLDPAAAALRFSKEYSICARCSAELTDDRSRAAGLGPTCRGYFGL